VKQLLAHFLDKLVNAFAPVVSQRNFEQMRTDDWLADVEADHDSWEPDELWDAHQRLTDAATPLACVSVTPAAAGTTSAGSAGGGGHLRDELIEQLVDEYRTKLNNWFRP